MILFSSPTCSWCRRAKRYFKDNTVAFKEINVEKDHSAARDIQRRTGQSGVPVTKMGGRWIVGFDKHAIERELARR